MLKDNAKYILSQFWETTIKKKDWQSKIDKKYEIGEIWNNEYGNINPFY